MKFILKMEILSIFLLIRELRAHCWSLAHFIHLKNKEKKFSRKKNVDFCLEFTVKYNWYQAVAWQFKKKCA